MTRADPIDKRLRRSTKAGRRPAYWYLRNGARSVINHLRTRELARANVAPPIMMGFVRRSGSTWVTHMVAQLSNVVSVGDPLLARNAFLPARIYDFPLTEMYFSPAAIAPAREYLDRVLRLKTRTATIDGWRDIDQTRPVAPFVKLANAPWLLDWFGSEFGAETCLLVRHPIEIARSQLRHWNMPPHLERTLATIRETGGLTPDQLDFAQEVQLSGTDFQKRLVEVVLEYKPIWNPNAAQRTISYARLRAGHLDDFTFLAGHDPDWRRAMARVMNKRSKTTQSRHSLGATNPFTDQEQADLDRTLIAFEATGILERL